MAASKEMYHPALRLTRAGSEELRKPDEDYNVAPGPKTFTFFWRAVDAKPSSVGRTNTFPAQSYLRSPEVPRRG